MKCLLGLSLFLAAFSSQAARLNCAQTKGWATVDMWAVASVQGEYQTLSADRAAFSDIRFDYKVYWEAGMDANDLWAQGFQSYVDLANEPNYSPRKYKDHMKFQVWVNASEPGSGFGDLDLIVPQKEIMAAKAADFTGYLIMSWIDDSWGGTVKLDCSIE